MKNDETMKPTRMRRAGDLVLVYKNQDDKEYYDEEEEKEMDALLAREGWLSSSSTVAVFTLFALVGLGLIGLFRLF